MSKLNGPIYCCSLLICLAQVTVQPESVVQAEGLEAVFECFYPGLASFDWFINGSRVFDTDPPPNITLGQSSNPLTILAIPLYNNSVIKCEARTAEEGVLFSNESSLVIYSEYLMSVQFLSFHLFIYNECSFNSLHVYCRH